MKELSAASGLPIATIKFYVREGLLHPGRTTSATQAEYDESHLERLRLVRALREVGEMPLARIEAVLAAIDDERTPLDDLLGEAHHALGPEPPDHPSASESATRAEVVEWVRSRGWTSRPEAPAFDVLAGALTALRELWQMPDCGPDIFTPYAEHADTIAEHELAFVEPSEGRAGTVRQIIVGTVVFERALVALRRLAQEHHSHLRFADPKVTSGRARRSPAGRGRTPARER